MKTLVRAHIERPAPDLAAARIGADLDLPDFAIIGAPKCGTTSLYAYLSRHPGVFMPQIKEPHFFAADLKGISRVGSLEDYRSLFASAPPGALKGEASATYLFSKVAVAELLKLRPDCRLIVMLRDPIAAVLSYHRQMLKGLLEDIEEFESAWRAQDERAKGSRIPPGCPDPSLLQYGPTFLYGEQLARLFDQLPPSQRHVILYEEFFSDPATGYGQVLDFLGLAQDSPQSFAVHNRGGDLRSRVLAKFYLSPPGWARALWAPFRPLAHRLGIFLPEILERANVAPSPAPAVSDPMMQELKTYFSADRDRVEALLGRGIDCWRR